jgi:hypothetical protein
MPDEYRSKATWHRSPGWIANELTVNRLVLHYRVSETDDGQPGEEGVFAICSF